MYDGHVNQLFDIFEKEGFDLYVVGGAVRNLGLGAPIQDIDFAANCQPDNILKLLEKNSIRAVETGLKHGTVTAVFSNDSIYEITSFRKDIDTDGRHAVTEFGGSLEDDARRRDFTINALYMDRLQNIIDPLGAKNDLDNRILRFVGQPQERIREDYLRILRFYRFLAQYHLFPCPKTCDACREQRDGLSKISAERVGSEMKRLLQGIRSDKAMQMMYEADIAPYVLESLHLDEYIQWQNYVRSIQLDKDWRAELVMLSEDTPEDMWRLSKNDRRIIEALRNAKNSQLSELEFGERFGAEIGIWGLHFSAMAAGEAVSDEKVAMVERGATLVFPVTGEDVKRLGYQGKAIGRKLSELKDLWRKSDYTKTKDSLLASLPQVE